MDEFLNYFQADLFIPELNATTKEELLTEMVNYLAAHRNLKDTQLILQMLKHREDLGSTGIGYGIAIPHGKCSGVKELVMAIGIAKDPIEFDSIDQKPVTIMVLLASPIDRTGPHIQALARISRLMLDDAFKEKLENSNSAEEVYELISDKEHE